MSRDAEDLRSRRQTVENRAVALFGVAVVAMAIVCGSIIVSGWFAGTMDDRFERVFWLGALLAGLMILVFAAACFPAGDDDAPAIRRTAALTRVGLILFVLSPALCIGALVADFYL